MSHRALPTTSRAKGRFDESDEEDEEEGLEAAWKEIAFSRGTKRLTLTLPRPSGTLLLQAGLFDVFGLIRRLMGGASKVQPQKFTV